MQFNKHTQTLIAFVALGLAYLFRERIIDAATGRVCTNKIDLLNIVDDSGSIGKQNWINHIVPALREYGQALKLSDDAARVGIISFSDRSRLVISLDSVAAKNHTQFENTLKNMEKFYSGGGTYPLDAFKIANLQLEHHKNRTGIPMVITFFTDGTISSKHEEEHTLLEAEKLKQNPDVRFMCVAIGDKVKKDFLKKLCDENYILTAQDTSYLTTTIRSMAQHICQMPPAIQDTTCYIETKSGVAGVFTAGMLAGMFATLAYLNRNTFLPYFNQAQNHAYQKQKRCLRNKINL